MTQREKIDWFDAIMLNNMADAGWNGHVTSKSYQKAKKEVFAQIETLITEGKIEEL